MTCEQVDPAEAGNQQFRQRVSKWTVGTLVTTLRTTGVNSQNCRSMGDPFVSSMTVRSPGQRDDSSQFNY